VKARRNVPSVDGARIRSNSTPVAPCRSTPIPSMQSAPAAMPATNDITFAPAFAPAAPGTVSHLPASAAMPTCSASATAGTRPADTTRFGSSKSADIADGA